MLEVKKIIKKYLPKFVIEQIKYITNKPIINYFKKSYKKKALLSYITHPFKKNSMHHTNYYEAQTWAKILDEIGYQVDIVQYDYAKKLNISKYDLICGFGDVFQYYFESEGNAKTIFYGTGMHVCHQNYASLKRVKDVYRKQGVWLTKSARLVEKTWTHQTSLVDGIIALGNDVCADSYRKYYDGLVYSLPAPFYKTQDGNSILKNRKSDSNKNFLWFGSSGLIHKGLDLLLDYFSNNEELTLHICGAIANEKDFVEVYKKELFNTTNIIYHGFVDIESEKFTDILISCSFVIFPSCSEGGAPSVLTAIGNGGLIPIITKETTISTGNEIFIETLDYNGIENAVKKAIKIDKDELKKLEKKNLGFVLNYHSKDNYKHNLKLLISNILEQRNEL